MRILLLEDDSDAADRVQSALANIDGIDLQVTGVVADAVRQAAARPFDALILDRMVLDGDGLDALSQLRGLGVRTPALILSNLSATRHRVEGLDAGADDYLVKPFEPEELVARLRAMLRRGSTQGHPEVFLLGELEVRAKARTAHWRNRYLDLSPKEFDMLAFFAANHDLVVSRQMLWDACWPEYRIPPQINVIDVNLSRLRAKIHSVAGLGLIETVRGQGFRLASGAAA
nr:response regulator transcription factor [uncultured Brevundimonas sp.]